MAFWRNPEVGSIWKALRKEEQQKAREILNVLNGANIERARYTLKFCEAAIEINAVIEILPDQSVVEGDEGK